MSPAISIGGLGSMEACSESNLHVVYRHTNWRSDRWHGWEVVECIGVGVAAVVRCWVFGLLAEEALYSRSQMETVVAGHSIGGWQATRT